MKEKEELEETKSAPKRKKRAPKKTPVKKVEEKKPEPPKPAPWSPEKPFN